jgi:drug/metabolite transporter (DMT)-like permease
MNKRKIAFSIIAIFFGIFMFVYGGYDDSPGAQLLGFLVVIFGIIGIVKNKKSIN